MVYDAVDQKEKVSCSITKANSGEWVKKELIITDARFNNRGENGADISLLNTDGHDDIFHMIEIEKIEK